MGMIETKTTKQIIDDDFWLAKSPDNSLTPLGVSNKYKVWVCLESLKKEIEKERLNIKSLDIKRPNACAYREGLLDTLIWLENTCLCISTEQKSIGCTAVERNAELNTDCFVSVEQTGEDTEKNKPLEVSSPVQNIKYDGWKKAVFSNGVWHYFKDNKIICNSKATFSTALPRKECNTFKCRKCIELLNIHKKICVCKYPMFVKHNGECQNCGGEL